jgi:hypothetical protein
MYMLELARSACRGDAGGPGSVERSGQREDAEHHSQPLLQHDDSDWNRAAGPWRGGDSLKPRAGHQEQQAWARTCTELTLAPLA